MKTTPTASNPHKLKPIETAAKIVAAEKRAELAKKTADGAKVRFKSAKKIYKRAKKTAKTERRHLKELKKILAAAKIALRRLKSATTSKRKKSGRKPHAVAKPAAGATSSASKL